MPTNGADDFYGWRRLFRSCHIFDPECGSSIDTGQRTRNASVGQDHKAEASAGPGPLLNREI
jgi:hypothetical protein